MENKELIRLRIGLQNSSPGQIYFIQIDHKDEGKLHKLLFNKKDGLWFPYWHLNMSGLKLGMSPVRAIGATAELANKKISENEKQPTLKFILVEGLTVHDPGLAQELSFAREFIASLGFVVVFILDAHSIDTIRSKAIDLWSWRAHHSVLSN